MLCMIPSLFQGCPAKVQRIAWANSHELTHRFIVSCRLCLEPERPAQVQRFAWAETHRSRLQNILLITTTMALTWMRTSRKWHDSARTAEQQRKRVETHCDVEPSECHSFVELVCVTS